MFNLVRVPPGARRVLALAGAFLLFAACAPVIEARMVKPPPDGATALIIGEIAAADPEARRLARFLREGLTDRLVRSRVFAIVYGRHDRVDGDSALVLSGSVDEADRGSDALRFALGSGLGRPRLVATFTINDADGLVYAAFTASSDEPGPGGLSGHWKPLSMESLAADLGTSAADAIVRWRSGEALAAAAVPWP